MNSYNFDFLLTMIHCPISTLRNLGSSAQGAAPHGARERASEKCVDLLAKAVSGC